MRDCYKKFWKKELVQGMHLAFPQFILKESLSRKLADEAKPSAKPLEFIWNPVDKLTFLIGFSAHPRQDYFEGYCKWSETGKSKAGVAWTMEPFSDATFSAPDTGAFVQVLSSLSDGGQRIFNWPFWKPSASIDDMHAFQQEFSADLQKEIGDDEAQRRVQIAVGRATADVMRLVLPWFERKLSLYKQELRGPNFPPVPPEPPKR